MRPAASIAIAGLVLCTACSADATQGDASSGTGTAPLPTLHLVRTVEELQAGRNPKQDDYHRTTKVCRDAGWPVRALAPDEVDRLGTASFELAFDADHRLVRTTRWAVVSETDADPARLCQFRFVETVEESYLDRRVSGGSDADAPSGWSEQPAEAGALDVYPVDAAQAADAHRMAAATGWTDAGVHGVAGQPCQAWTRAAPATRLCMWTGGHAWGLSELPEENALTDPPGTAQGGLTLEQEPLDGTGQRIRTERFTVGAPLPPTAVVPRSRPGSAR